MEDLSFIQQVVIELLGKELTTVILATSYIFAGIGIFLRWYWMYQRRGKPNPHTPHKFILSYWIRDNFVPAIVGIFATFILIFISLRFPKEIFGTAVSYMYAFMVGMSLDFVASKLKKLRIK